MVNQYYCNAPFEHIYVEERELRPCCWWKPTDDISTTDFTTGTVGDGVKNMRVMFEHPKINAIRKRMTTGQELTDNCIQCKTHEALGGRSHRFSHNKSARTIYNYSETHGIYPKPEIKTMELNLGNLCNLACVMCGSHNSTKWYEDDVKLYGMKKGQLRTSFGDKFVKSDAVEHALNIDDLDWDLLKNVTGIKLAGGENLMMPQHTKLLETLIEKDLAKNIGLLYVVNATHDPLEHHPNWKKFRKIHIIISIDGIGDVAEYIRYHTVWKEVDENIQKYFNLVKEHENYIISTNTTVSLLNVTHLVDIYDYWNFQYIKHLQRTPVESEQNMYRLLSSPDHLHIKHIPDEFRKDIINKLDTVEKLQHISQELRADNETNKWSKSIKWIEKLDNIRGNNFYDVNPQFKS